MLLTTVTLITLIIGVGSDSLRKSSRENSMKAREIQEMAVSAQFDTDKVGLHKTFNWEKVTPRTAELSRPEANLFYLASNVESALFFGCFKMVGAKTPVVSCGIDRMIIAVAYGNIFCGTVEVIHGNGAGEEDCEISTAVIDDKGAVKTVTNKFPPSALVDHPCSYDHKGIRMNYLSLMPPGEEILVTYAGIFTDFTSLGFTSENATHFYFKELISSCERRLTRKLSAVSCSMEVEYDKTSHRSTLVVSVLSPGELVISSDKMYKTLDCADSCSIDLTGSSEVSVTCPNGVQHHLLVEKNLRYDCYGCDWPVIGFVMLMLGRASQRPGYLGSLIIWGFLGGFIVQLMFIIFSWITSMLSWIIGKLVYENDEELGTCQDCKTLFLNERLVKRHLTCKNHKCPWCCSTIGDGKAAFQKHCSSCREYTIAKHKDLKSCLIRPSKFQELSQWAEALVYYRIGVRGLKWLIFLIIFIIAISPTSAGDCRTCSNYNEGDFPWGQSLILSAKERICRDFGKENTVPGFEMEYAGMIEAYEELFDQCQEVLKHGQFHKFNKFIEDCSDVKAAGERNRSAADSDEDSGEYDDDEVENVRMKRSLYGGNGTYVDSNKTHSKTIQYPKRVMHNETTLATEPTTLENTEMMSDSNNSKKIVGEPEKPSKPRVGDIGCDKCILTVQEYFEKTEFTKEQIVRDVKMKENLLELTCMYGEWMVKVSDAVSRVMMEDYDIILKEWLTKTNDVKESLEEIYTVKRNIDFETIVSIESEICGMKCWNGPDVCRCPMLNMTSDLDGTIKKELEVIKKLNDMKSATRKVVFDGRADDFLTELSRRESLQKENERRKRSINEKNDRYNVEEGNSRSERRKGKKGGMSKNGRREEAKPKRSIEDGAVALDTYLADDEISPTIRKYGLEQFSDEENKVLSNSEVYLNGKLHCKDCYISHRAMIKYKSSNNKNRNYALLSSLDQIQTDWGMISINDVYHPTEDETNTDLTWETHVKTKDTVKVKGIATGKINIGVLSGITWKIENSDSDEKKLISVFIYDASQVYSLTPKWCSGSRYLSEWYKGVCTGDCPKNCDCHEGSHTCHVEVFDYDRGWNCNPTWCWTAHGGCSCCAVDVLSRGPKWIVERVQAKHIRSQMVICIRIGSDRLQCLLASTNKKIKIGSSTITISAPIGEINHLPDEISLVHYNQGSNDMSITNPDEIWINDRSCKDSCTHGRLGDFRGNNIISYLKGIFNPAKVGVEMNWAGTSITHTCHRGDWPTCDYHNIKNDIDDEISSVNKTADHLKTDYTIKALDYGTDGSKLMVLPKYKTGMVDITLEMNDVVLSRKEIKFELSSMSVRGCDGCYGCSSGFECEVTISAKNYGFFSIHLYSNTRFITIDQNSRTLNLTDTLSSRMTIHGISMMNETEFEFCVEEAKKCTSVKLSLREPEKKLLRKESLVSIKTNNDLNQSSCTGFGWFACLGSNIARLFSNAWDWIAYVFSNGLLWMKIVIPIIIILVILYILFRIYKVIKMRKAKKNLLDEEGYISAIELNRRIKEKERMRGDLVGREKVTYWNPLTWKNALAPTKVRFQEDMEMKGLEIQEVEPLMKEEGTVRMEPKQNISIKTRRAVPSGLGYDIGQI